MTVIRVKFDRPSTMLAMMERFAGEGLRLLPIHGVVDGRCTCGDKRCESPGKHPISTLVHHGVKSATTDLKTIRKWHETHPDMNYAVATDGLAVIDCDSKEAIREFRKGYRPPPTLSVKTARGFHFYFRGDMPTRIGVQTKLDIKSGSGSYVVGPCSRHASGAIYALWDDEPFADLPDNIAGIGRERPKPETADGNAILPKGQRNSLMTSLAGSLRRMGASEDAILATLRATNKVLTNDPLPERELKTIASSVSRYPAKELPQTIPFSDIPEELLEWLWYPYICLGTLGLLDGDPGDGKSQFMAWLCARISRGHTLPNGEKIKPGNCFLFNFEDLPGAVIKRRLEANGADLSRVFIQSRRFQLTQELVDWLDGEVAEKEPCLIILDPIQAFMTGDFDSSNNVAVREFMGRLAEVAERRKCAIICVRHFGKAGQDKAMKKGIGSTDFIGISRNQFGLARRNDGVRGFIVFHMKTNFEKGQAMLYTMGEADGRKGMQPVIGFEGFTDIDENTFFSSNTGNTRGPEQDERQVAKDYLLEALAGGPKSTKAIKLGAEARSITASTLDRARKELKIEPRKIEGAWVWSIPPE